MSGKGERVVEEDSCIVGLVTGSVMRALAEVARRGKSLQYGSLGRKLVESLGDLLNLCVAACPGTCYLGSGVKQCTQRTTLDANPSVPDRRPEGNDPLPGMIYHCHGLNTGRMSQCCGDPFNCWTECFSDGLWTGVGAEQHAHHASSLLSKDNRCHTLTEMQQHRQGTLGTCTGPGSDGETSASPDPHSPPGSPDYVPGTGEERKDTSSDEKERTKGKRKSNEWKRKRGNDVRGNESATS